MPIPKFSSQLSQLLHCQENQYTRGQCPLSGQWQTLVTTIPIRLMYLIIRILLNTAPQAATDDLLELWEKNLFATPECGNASLYLLDVYSMNNSEGDSPGWWKEHCTWSQIT